MNDDKKWVIIEEGTGRRIGGVYESKESAEKAKQVKLTESAGGSNTTLKVQQLLCG
jgi:hypothetical protein